MRNSINLGWLLHKQNEKYQKRQSNERMCNLVIFRMIDGVWRD